LQELNRDLALSARPFGHSLFAAAASPIFWAHLFLQGLGIQHFGAEVLAVIFGISLLKFIS
jgi:hypothetical protein